MKKVGNFTQHLLFGASILLCFIGMQYTLAATDYADKLNECIKKRADGSYNSITEYICPDKKDLHIQQIAYQIIFDIESKKIDEKIEKELRELQQTRSKDVALYESWIREKLESTSPQSQYYKSYQKLCNPNEKDSIVQIAERTIKEYYKKYAPEKTDGASLNTGFDTGDFFTSATCENLGEYKLDAYTEAAWIFAKKSVSESYQEDETLYQEGLNENYQRLLDKFMIYIGKLSEIDDKMPGITPIVQ